MTKRKLGRGLSSLLDSNAEVIREDETATAEGSTSDEIPIDRIVPNRSQPREKSSDDNLQGLVESVSREGVLQPVVVRELPDGGYELIAGERRWRAAQKAGLKTIPAVVRKVTDDRLLELALIENVQREDLNAIEQAKAYRQLMTALNLTQEEAAARLGLQRSTLANALRLLELPTEIQDLVSRGTISAGHARAILSLPTPFSQVALAKKIVSEGLSVRATEMAAALLLGRQVALEERKKPKAPHIRELEEELKRVLGLPVIVKERKRGGRVIIDFKNHEQFEFILEMLGVKMDDGI